MSNTEGRFRDCARVEGMPFGRIPAGHIHSIQLIHPSLGRDHRTKHHYTTAASSPALPILENLRFPPLLQFRLSTRRLRRLSNLTLDSLPRSQHFTLQVKTPSLLRIIDIE